MGVFMARKGVILIVAVLVAILALVGIYYIYEAPSDDNIRSTALDVYSEGPMSLSDIIGDIETASYYEGYDNDTLNWMKSLGNKAVFSGNGTFVVMDINDAGKIPSQYVTDVTIIEHIECDVIETHSLGDVDYPRDVMLVKNVKYLGEEIIDMGLA